MKVLTGERDRLTELYDEAKDELQRTRHDFVRKTPATKSASASSGLAAAHVLKRVESVSVLTVSEWVSTVIKVFIKVHSHHTICLRDSCHRGKRESLMGDFPCSQSHPVTVEAVFQSSTC